MVLLTLLKCQKVTGRMVDTADPGQTTSEGGPQAHTQTFEN